MSKTARHGNHARQSKLPSNQKERSSLCKKVDMVVTHWSTLVVMYQAIWNQQLVENTVLHQLRNGRIAKLRQFLDDEGRHAVAELEASLTNNPQSLTFQESMFGVLHALKRLAVRIRRWRPPRKRRVTSANARPLTDRQLEALQFVNENNGNVAEAARRLGRDRKTVEQHYKAAMKKLRKAGVKHKTIPAPKDQRGQITLTRDDDRRRE